ncbi:SPOR domain-containing protein, partial [Sulfitobacter sp. 15WGC]|uniref:SPOR domain-containing protein n=1 Tax=Sulfitobacter sp. 15WGC TaxID=2575437 RepID=UPI00200A3DA7
QSAINNKPFWRVVIGPATSKSELDTLLKKVKAEGFTDAYAVSTDKPEEMLPMIRLFAAAVALVLTLQPAAAFDTRATAAYVLDQ